MDGLEADEARLDKLEVRDAAFAAGSLANARALRSDWRRVRFGGTRLTGIQLGEALLADVVFEGARLDLASFRLSRLERVVFRDCRLEEADFGSARLESVLFERSPLTGASFAGATLARVELRDCDLDGLTGPEGLRGARMSLDDALANVRTLAAAAGVEVVD